MGLSEKKKRQRTKKREQKQNKAKTDPPNQEILDSIGSPNAWTPAMEDAWLLELRNISTEEIYRRFPPCKKPPSVRKRGKSNGWGDNV